MRILFTMLLLICRLMAHCQEHSLQQYQVADSNIRKNKIRTIQELASNKSYTTEYDSLGRKIANWYDNPGLRYTMIYKQHGDTVLRLLYFVNDTLRKKELVQTTKYLYDKTGRIILHADLYKNDQQYSAQMTRFYYDSLGRLDAKLFYYKHRYSNKDNEYFSLAERLFDLRAAWQYRYDPKDRPVLARQLLGNSGDDVDSFFYDRQGCLSRELSFVKYGSMGEIMRHNISRSKVYTYTDSSRITKKSVSYGAEPEETGGWDEGTEEQVLLENGQIDKLYFLIDHKANLYKEYKYTYFE